MIKTLFLSGAGITLFLFGMLRLSTGIQKLFTARIRSYIRYAVRRPFWGLMTGVVATVLFQSSSATSVIAVGMVSAGIISFYHSLAVILGADIGTTVIVQLVVWKIGDLSPLFIMAGGILWAAGGSRWRTAGESIFYFGMLFFGLNLIGMSVEPLKGSPEVVRIFKEIGSPLTGFILCTLFAGLVHASAIPISILVILGLQNLITLDHALPMVLGANVGTAVTALMAAAVADLGGKRTALSHFVFKAAGAAVCMAILPAALSLLRLLADSVAQQIALGHFLFNIFVVGLFFFILKPFSRIMIRLVPGQQETLPLWPEFLDEKNLAIPEEALEGVRKELEREALLSQKIFAETGPLHVTYREGKRRNIRYIEMVVNHLRGEIVAYLRSLSGQTLSPELSKKLFAYTAIADDVERMTNHMVNLVDLARIRSTLKISFTAAAMEELNGIQKLVGENIADIVILMAAPAGERERIGAITEREERIDRTVREARDNHLVRFHQRLCQAEAGPVFLEMLIHLERISDHCQNVAESLDELNHGE